MAGAPEPPPSQSLISSGSPKGGPLSFFVRVVGDNPRVDEIEVLHAGAIAEGRDTYVDPKTGYDVFTSAYLFRIGICCGSGCRHCPYGHENVEPAKRWPEEDGEY